MFDGTDLNAAYGTSLSDLSGDMGGGGGGFLQAAPTVQLPPPPQSSTTAQIVLPPPSAAPAPAVSAGSMSHATPPEVPYYPPNAMYARGGAGTAGAGVAGGWAGDSMWDKLSSKKYDVLKLVLLSLVILLAMSSDRVIHHYLLKYLTGGIFTGVQEFLVRLSYPLVVLVVLWLVKASM